ncbi:hypothetical protein [Bacillus spizizenii]|uniref:hypothetical protein n=1 Tax=Bacillus spizizenii TaxID=96241 RepID=UPI00036CF7B7|nr:hypothetical protein [Bacillus spizizenii]
MNNENFNFENSEEMLNFAGKYVEEKGLELNLFPGHATKNGVNITIGTSTERFATNSKSHTFTLYFGSSEDVKRQIDKIIKSIE